MNETTGPRSVSSGRKCVDFIAINYAPEVTGIAPYVTDITRRLAARGWSVRVVTGYPHYPQWHLDGEMSDYTSTVVDHGVIVVRVPHSIPEGTALVARSRMELEFGMGAIVAHLRPEAVTVMASPPLIASAMVMLRRKLGRRRLSPMGVWVHDLYSQAVSEAASGGSLSRTLVGKLERFALRAADEIAVVHPRFGEIIVDRLGVDPKVVTHVRNWTQVQHDARVARASARERLGIPSDAIVAVHAGNMGQKQGLENLVDAARLIDGTDDPSTQQVHIYLVGDGNQRRQLEERARGCTSLTFVDSLPDDEFHLMLSAADVLVVNEKPGVVEMSLPSKLTTYFSYGLPVVASVADDGITAGEVRRSGGGVVVPAGDPAALVSAITLIATDADAAEAIGEAGARYAREVLGADAAVERFELWLHKLAQHASVRA
ncbi:glycosyltransferase family 4 protein [Gordonia sp. 'Campus']|uniref:glycosyltransferase family 4 protein n=1 Tax=Gordonia sp. 'Campus' TaxID=2915824 RepID=UPI001EE46106|nr:glycosyltransferase family 4 protein [Gordonia sp. 'Campus']